MASNRALRRSDVRGRARPRCLFQGSEEARPASLRPNPGSNFSAVVAVWQPACPAEGGQIGQPDEE